MLQSVAKRVARSGRLRCRSICSALCPGGGEIAAVAFLTPSGGIVPKTVPTVATGARVVPTWTCATPAPSTMADVGTSAFLIWRAPQADRFMTDCGADGPPVTAISGALGGEVCRPCRNRDIIALRAPLLMVINTACKSCSGRHPDIRAAIVRKASRGAVGSRIAPALSCRTDLHAGTSFLTWPIDKHHVYFWQVQGRNCMKSSTTFAEGRDVLRMF